MRELRAAMKAEARTSAGARAGIPPRRIDFQFSDTPTYPIDDNALATAFLAVLSGIFPPGERFFAESVRRPASPGRATLGSHGAERVASSVAVWASEHRAAMLSASERTWAGPFASAWRRATHRGGIDSSPVRAPESAADIAAIASVSPPARTALLTTAWKVRRPAQETESASGSACSVDVPLRRMRAASGAVARASTKRPTASSFDMSPVSTMSGRATRRRSVGIAIRRVIFRRASTCARASA